MPGDISALACRPASHAPWAPRRLLLSYVIIALAPWKERGVRFRGGGEGKEAVLGLGLITTAQTGSRMNMATCADILRSEFPEIDGQVFDYVTGKRNGINCRGRLKWRS